MVSRLDKSGLPKWKQYVSMYGQMTPKQVLTRTRQLTPPIDVVAIASELDVRVLEVGDLGADGMLRIDDDDDATIFVERFQSKVRRRFTIAHEIGHLMLHGRAEATRDEGRGYSFYRDTLGEGTGRIETEANRFGAALLMPEWLLVEHGRRLEWDARALAELFEVSKPAMDIRIERTRGTIYFI